MITQTMGRFRRSRISSRMFSHAETFVRACAENFRDYLCAISAKLSAFCAISVFFRVFKEFLSLGGAVATHSLGMTSGFLHFLEM